LKELINWILILKLKNYYQIKKIWNKKDKSIIFLKSIYKVIYYDKFVIVLLFKDLYINNYFYKYV
jgi:hypothetical protein